VLLRHKIDSDRQAAARWAAELLADPAGLVILDTETTGLGPTDEIAEIAVIDGAGEVLIDTLVKPTRPIPVAAWNIHGIADADVASAPTMADLWSHILAAVAGRQLVIYNAAYDLTILDQSCMARDMPDLNLDQLVTVHCAMRQYAAFVGEWNEYHGNYRWQRLPGGDHSALGDARATLDLLRQMAGGDA
jgi:DNA polymerase-3 subunit epsilon